MMRLTKTVGQMPLAKLHEFCTYTGCVLDAKNEEVTFFEVKKRFSK